MGTRTLGNTAAGVQSKWIFFDSSIGVSFRAEDGAQTATEDMYVDGIYVYCRPHKTSSILRHAIYKTNSAFVAQAPQAHGWAGSGQSGSNPGTAEWTHSEWYASGFLFLQAGLAYQGAVLASSSAGLYTETYSDNLSFYYETGISNFPTSANWSTKSAWGSLPWYLTYFPTATISSITSTPVFPGQTFTVNGRSFTAGINSVTVNGVACTFSSINVVNDTQLTAVVPTGASTGKVQVATNAGTATSGANLVVSGGRIFHSGSLISDQSVRVAHNGSLVQVSSIRTARMVNGSLVLTDVH